MAVNINRQCRVRDLIETPKNACDGVLFLRPVATRSGARRVTLLLCSNHAAEARIAGWVVGPGRTP